MGSISHGARVGMVLAQRAGGEFFEDGCLQRAAAISYYSLLSLFPLTIVLVSVFGVVVDDDAARQRVIEFVLDNVPLREDGGRADLEDLLQAVTASRGGFGVFGVAGLLFAASAVMGAIRHALNAAWEVTEGRPLLRAKLIDLLMVFLTGAVIVSSLVMTLAVQFTASLGDRLGGPGALAHDAILLAGRLVPALLALVVCALVFLIVPARRTRLRDIWPGVLVAVTGFELAKAGFSLYLENAANYGAVYASLGGIVAFLVFIFVTANLFLLGAEAASEWPSVRDEPLPEPTQEPLKQRLRSGLRGLVVSASDQPADREHDQDDDRSDDQERPERRLEDRPEAEDRDQRDKQN
ncbi:MAG: YihY/virulence factor BrkB family protein [Actinobacteria bacterium]|nr:YihY/virulence factor BrkB family protein [Actinomycetota bacterium]